MNDPWAFTGTFDFENHARAPGKMVHFSVPSDAQSEQIEAKVYC